MEEKAHTSAKSIYLRNASSRHSMGCMQGAQEKTNSEGCLFYIVDSFPSRKYQTLSGTLQNRFSFFCGPGIYPFKVWSCLGPQLMSVYSGELCGDGGEDFRRNGFHSW